MWWKGLTLRTRNWIETFIDPAEAFCIHEMTNRWRAQVRSRKHTKAKIGRLNQTACTEYNTYLHPTYCNNLSLSYSLDTCLYTHNIFFQIPLKTVESIWVGGKRYKFPYENKWRRNEIKWWFVSAYHLYRLAKDLHNFLIVCVWCSSFEVCFEGSKSIQVSKRTAMTSFRCIRRKFSSLKVYADVINQKYCCTYIL